jgi:hypothetical protein
MENVKVNGTLIVKTIANGSGVFSLGPGILVINGLLGMTALGYTDVSQRELGY